MATTQSTRLAKRAVGKAVTAHVQAGNPVVGLVDGHAQTVELAEWENMTPIGREFGSPDYERLEELDRLTVEACGDLLLARRWLDTPHPALKGLTPEDAAKTPEGFAQVRQLLASYSGMFEI
ncbi:MAG: MbcA/ParS/Xre antitoxin family protein [Acidovorax sp.]